MSSPAREVRALRRRAPAASSRLHASHPTGRRGTVLALILALIAQVLALVGPAAAGTAVPIAAAATASVSLALDAGLSGGTYVGFNPSATHPNAQNLTAAGTTDWRVWGRTGILLPSDDHKSGGTGISGLTDINPAPAIPLRALGGLNLGIGVGPGTEPFSFAWTDGTIAPNATGVRAGLQHNNSTSSLAPGYGFSFTVPTSADPQRLSVWVSAHHGTGRLTAAIGGVTQTDTGISGGQNHGGVYTIDFQGTGAVGETMTVSYVLASAVNSSVLDSDGYASTEANVVVYAAALKPVQTAAAAPILVRAVGGTGGGIAGRVQGATPSSTQDVTFYHVATCDPVALDANSLIGSITVNTDTTGAAQYVVSLAGLVPGGFVTATAKDAGHSTSPYAQCVALGANNDSWPNALDIGATGGNAGHTTDPGYVLDQSGQSRWYKFPVAPGEHVTVDLTGLPADYDLALFTDITKAYTTLTSPSDLTKISANFAGQAFSAQAFSAQAFSGQAFSPDAYSAQAFSADAFSADVFAGQAFSAQAFSGQAFSAQAFSGQAFSAQAFSGQAFSAQAFSGQAFSAQAFSGQAFSAQAFSPLAAGQAFSPQAFSSAQVQSVIAVSALSGTNTEHIVANTWNNSGFYYVRVTSHNGAFDLDSPFTLHVTQSGTSCANVQDTGSAPTAQPGAGIKTVILTDSSRIPGDDTAKGTLATRLSTFAQQPEVAGAVVDVAADPRLQALNQQADGNPACPYAKNLVADALKDIVDSYRANNPGLKYVVLVGGDATIPFFRYPDESLLAPESQFTPPLKPNSASEASLQLNYVLSQDAYGSNVQVLQNANTFPVPDLAVGRLVETATEATGMLDAYLATGNGVVATPTSSLVTGYDFLSDAATTVAGDLGTGTGHTPDELITAEGTAPTDGWTATQLKAQLLGGTRHDLVFLAGHFNPTSALSADFQTTIDTSELAASTTDFVNSIVFSAGCHSGYNTVDPDANTDPLDWAQAFAQKGATLVAGTGYQYGDTDFLLYSEQIYASFAHQLILGTGPVSVGDALLQAKQAYLRSTPTLRGIDTKALLESTLFGLPMLSVDLPNRVGPTGDSSVVAAQDVASGPGHDLGLKTATLDVNGTDDPLHVHTQALTGVKDVDNHPTPDATATYYSGTAGVTSKPFEPALPLVSKNVTVPGTTLRGVGFWAGSYSDSTVIPLTGAAGEDLRGVHGAFGSPVFYPMRLAIPNYFDAFGNGTTRLLVTPAQHQGATLPNSTLRLYSDVNLKLFYSSNIASLSVVGGTVQPGLAAPPSFLDVNAAATPTSVNVDTHVVGDPSAGMQEVWVSWTGFDHQWHSADLTQDPTDSTHWSGTIAVPSGKNASDIRFMLQAVNGVGLVAVNDNFGADYSVQPFNTQSQTITFAQPDDATFGDPDFSISASSSSGLPVTLTASGACSVSPATSPSIVHLTGAGNCTITASQAGNAMFTPATNVLRSFAIAKADQAITFGPLADHTFGDADFAVSASSDSNLAVTFSAGGACTVTGSTVHLTGGGACTITARQAGNGSYNAAPDVPQSFNTAKADQSITFGSLGGKTYLDPQFSVTATASSGLTVTFAASGQCTVSTATVTLTGAGSCSITASQAGNGSYNPAPDVIQAFSIAKAAGSVSIGNVPGAGVAIIGGTFTPAYAQAGTGTPSSVSNSTAICTVSGGVVSFVAAGTCSLTPSVLTDPNYLAATGAAQTFTVNKKPQTITLTSPLLATYGDLYTPTATASSNLTPVTFSLGAGSNCTFASGKFTMTSSGTCNVVASQAGNGAWAPATQAFAITIAKKPATIGFTGNLFWSAGSGTTTTVTLTAKIVPATGGTVNVANSKVAFQLFPNGVMTAAPTTCSVTTAITSAGVATCSLTLGLGNWAVVATMPDANNAYFTAPNADAVELTVYQVLKGSYAAGAGSVVDPSTSNIPVKVAAAPHNLGYFAFSVSYKSGTTPQGFSIYSFRGNDGYDYIFTTTSWTGGGLSFGSGTASFSSKCSVTAMNPATHKVVSGIGGTNFTCRYDVTDAATDKLALSVYTSGGALYHQVGTTAAQLTVTGGGIVAKK